jgi:hypothetical protein
MNEDQSQDSLLTKYYQRGRVTENEMGGACGMQREEEKCILGFGGEI